MKDSIKVSVLDELFKKHKTLEDFKKELHDIYFQEGMQTLSSSIQEKKKSFKVGDKVWSKRWDMEHTIIMIRLDKVEFEITAKGADGKHGCWKLDGRYYESDKHPDLFHSKEECEAYFNNLNSK